MGLAARGNAFLNRAQFVASGVSIVYTRGVLTVPLTAIPGQEDRDEAVTPGVSRSIDRERDYLILVADLTAFGVPQEGDRITELIGGTPVVQRVSKQDREPCYRFSDHQQTRYRIHTRAA